MAMTLTAVLPSFYFFIEQSRYSSTRSTYTITTAIAFNWSCSYSMDDYDPEMSSRGSRVFLKIFLGGMPPDSLQYQHSMYADCASCNIINDHSLPYKFSIQTALQLVGLTTEKLLSTALCMIYLCAFLQELNNTHLIV